MGRSRRLRLGLGYEGVTAIAQGLKVLVFLVSLQPPPVFDYAPWPCCRQSSEGHSQKLDPTTQNVGFGGR